METQVTTSPYIALRDFSMQGETYTKGQPVDVTRLPDRKLQQMLNQRFLRPEIPTSNDA